MNIRGTFIFVIVASLWLAVHAAAQTSALLQPHARIVQAVDESASVTLLGNVHPLIAVAAASESSVDIACRCHGVAIQECVGGSGRWYRGDNVHRLHQRQAWSLCGHADGGGRRTGQNGTGHSDHRR